MSPGAALKVYRERKGLTQAALGEALGGVRHQNIGAMELDGRPIGRFMARRLAAFFGVPVGRFLR